MTSVNDLLVRVLKHGTTPQVQHLAWEAAVEAGKKGNPLLRALAGTPNLDDELRLRIARCNFSEARVRLWERKDISIRLIREFLPKERSADAISAMFDSAKDRDAVLDLLRVKMNAAHVQAVLRTAAKWQWPSDIVIQAARANPVAASHVDWKKLDVTSLAKERTLDPLVRLAACASELTSAGVVAAELPGIIAELEYRSSNSDRFRACVLLKKISKRPADARVGQALTAAGATHEWVPQEVIWAVEGWEDLGPAVSDPASALDCVRRPEDLHQLWSAMNDQQREEMLRTTVGHEWCDKALLDIIRQQFELKDMHRMGWRHSLWSLQDGELFADTAVNVRLANLLHFAIEHRDYALPFEELLRPVFDRLCASDWKSAEPSLHALLSSGVFPRTWLHELPLSLVAKLLKAYPGEDLAWVAQEMSALFETVADDPKVFLPLLYSFSAEKVPLGTAVQAALCAVNT